MDFRCRDYLTSPARLLKLRAWMNRTPKWPAPKMQAWSLNRLREITGLADRKIPFYGELFARIGFKPKRLSDFDYWQRLPILDKDTVRAAGDRLHAADSHKLGAVRCTTSGSTGTAMQFLLDREVNMASFALFWRVWNECPTWRIGRRQASLSGYASGEWEYQRLTRILALSSFHLTRENARAFHGLIDGYRPAFLRGYPSALYLFAKFLDQERLRLRFPVVFTGAESLLPFQRQMIENTFGCRVVDHYSHWERCGSICQCKFGRYHAHNDYGYHEIVDADGMPAEPGKLGRLVVTSLHNRAMPLLRYDTRDLAAWSEEPDCPCGSNFPVIDRIEGRIEDVFLTPSGRLVGRLDAAFKHSPHIRMAQIIQETVGRVRVLTVRDDGYNAAEDEAPLTRGLQARLGEQVEITYENVSEIPRTRMGKLRFAISRVDPIAKLGHH
jgi:phenylacetate-CoA ligase